MQSREELHKLIDSMPEGAIEAAQRILSQLQVWPPTPPPGVQEMRQRMKERRLEVMQHQKPGTIAGFGGVGNYDPAPKTGYSSFSHWDGDTYVTEILRRHQGYAFKVIERIRVEDKRLIYKHEITGPGGKRDEREITFELA
jgi:hypothetical protein